jgi:hypothetical protein
MIDDTEFWFTLYIYKFRNTPIPGRNFDDVLR